MMADNWDFKFSIGDVVKLVPKGELEGEKLYGNSECVIFAIKYDGQFYVRHLHEFSFTETSELGESKVFNVNGWNMLWTHNCMEYVRPATRDELLEATAYEYRNMRIVSMNRISSDSLGNRLKSYEALSTSRQLMPNCPVYARIDGRAFHTLCRGLKKPYSMAFIETMQEVCKYLVEETGAILGYVQSDEISLGWVDYSKAPFEGRIQKLESVLASMASAKFVQYVSEPRTSGFSIDDGMAKLWYSCIMHIPSFDCRVFNLPSMVELANAFLWRENDAIKNSVTGMALNFFSHKQIQGKSGEEKIAMMKEKGYDFYRDTDEAFLRGTFFQRENYLKKLTDEEVERIPEEQRVALIKSLIDGSLSCWRSRIAPMYIPYRLTDIENKEGALFYGELARKNKDNPTFDLSKRG